MTVLKANSLPPKITVLLVLASFLTTASSSAAKRTLSFPDPHAGVINGRVAINAVPATFDATGNAGPVDTDGCEVHLVRADDQAIETTYYCGEWFQPIPGKYLLWLEQASRISDQTLLNYAGEVAHDVGKVFLKELKPATTVALNPSVELPSNSTLRVLSLRPPNGRRPFDRRINAAVARNPFRVPAGPLLGGIFDSSGRAVAISNTDVVAGRTSTITPTRPDRRSATLLVLLSRFVRPRDVSTCDAQLMSSDGSASRPDAELDAYDRIVLLWTDVKPVTSADVQVRCGDGGEFRKRVDLTSGTTETIRSEIVKSSNGKGQQ